VARDWLVRLVVVSVRVVPSDIHIKGGTGSVVASDRTDLEPITA
jgi:hypothetical protein